MVPGGRRRAPRLTTGALVARGGGCFDGTVTADRAPDSDPHPDHPATDPFDATMVPALPCRDIDELRDF